MKILSSAEGAARYCTYTVSERDALQLVLMVIHTEATPGCEADVATKRRTKVLGYAFLNGYHAQRRFQGKRYTLIVVLVYA